MTRAEPRVAIHFDVDRFDVRLRAFWGRRPVVESAQTEKFWETLSARPLVPAIGEQHTWRFSIFRGVQSTAQLPSRHPIVNRTEGATRSCRQVR